MCSYLVNRKQEVVTNNSASTTKTVVAGVPQRYIGDPLLFSFFINDLILFIQYAILVNDADDNNICISGNDKENLKELLLYGNCMIINPDKCSHMSLSKNNNDDDTFSFSDFNLKNSNEGTIVGIKID